ncbi:putative RAS small monomeric GTPase [Aspergillus mulundensis]|uniref:Putative GTPase Ras2p n=1 Tax=Aspergillus mulundensis TaxID=1810919 RepID=A0A3D8SLF8_9EURO|nr:putative GTPase Ras2p [Aspergillus mulundensis]RDW87175.1 putative GTPase Ras2p [Aspergillus mulundensis]
MGDAPNKIAITICGDGGCGKSSITLRLVRSEWVHEYDPTIEDSYSVSRTIDGEQYFLSITDTAGQEEYRGLWAASNLKSDAFLLVYDITSESSLNALDYFMEMIEMETDQRAEDNLRLMRELGDSARGVEFGMAAPVKIVAGNKCDLKDNRVISAREGLEYARKHNSGFMETSAREMVNIEETFALLVRRVVEARREHHQHNQELTKPTRHVGFSLKKPPTGAVSKKASDTTLSKQTNQRQGRFHGLLKGRRANTSSEQSEIKPESPPEMNTSEGETPSRWKRLCC